MFQLNNLIACLTWSLRTKFRQYLPLTYSVCSNRVCRSKPQILFQQSSWSAVEIVVLWLIYARFYRGTQGVIVVYDVTSSSSFTNVKRWLQEIENNCDPSVQKLLGTVSPWLLLHNSEYRLNVYLVHFFCMALIVACFHQSLIVISLICYEYCEFVIRPVCHKYYHSR